MNLHVGGSFSRALSATKSPRLALMLIYNTQISSKSIPFYGAELL